MDFLKWFESNLFLGNSLTDNLDQLMQPEGIKPDPVTFVGILKACTSVAGLEEGECVHIQIIQSGCKSDVSVAITLIDMYMKCGSIGDAQNLFQNMPTFDVISLNVVLFGYLKCGQGQKALALSRQMQQEGVQPNQRCHFHQVPECVSQCCGT
jgi:pentatricopeptide repeat protein